VPPAQISAQIVANSAKICFITTNICPIFGDFSRRDGASAVPQSARFPFG
jgi:hypothetical protein